MELAIGVDAAIVSSEFVEAEELQDVAITTPADIAAIANFIRNYWLALIVIGTTVLPQ